jgi:hypothetical protein
MLPHASSDWAFAGFLAMRPTTGLSRSVRHNMLSAALPIRVELKPPHTALKELSQPRDYLLALGA